MAKYNFAQLENIWTRNGGQKKLAPLMASIALAESGGYTQAHHTNADGTVDQGLWQINSSNYRLYKGHNVYGVNENAKVAVRLANGGKGLGNWTTYTSGAYKKYLPSKGGGITGDVTTGLKDVSGWVTSPAGPVVGIATGAAGTVIGGVGSKVTGAVTSPIEKGLEWFGMRIVFALIIMGGGGLILLGLLLIGADLGLAAFGAAQAGQKVQKVYRIPAARRARKSQAARSAEIHGQKVRMGEAKIKTEGARATELRTRTRHRAALAKQSTKATERTKREAYYQGAADAASPTMAKIRKQRKGKKAA